MQVQVVGLDGEQLLILAQRLAGAAGLHEDAGVLLADSRVIGPAADVFFKVARA